MLRAASVPVPPESAVVLAELVPFSITSVFPPHIGDTGQVTITIDGARFQTGALVRLEGPAGTIPADVMKFVDSSEVKARFFFNGASNAVYNLVLQNPDTTSAISSNAVTIEPSTGIHVILNTGGNRTPRERL